MQLSELERKALKVLYGVYDHEGNCLYFSEIARRSRLRVREARRATRALARKGLAELVRGLFTDDGKLAGSGYCCTRAGARLMQPKNGTAKAA